MKSVHYNKAITKKQRNNKREGGLVQWEHNIFTEGIKNRRNGPMK